MKHMMKQPHQLPEAGLGLRYHYLDEVVSASDLAVDFFEIHPENYMNRHGKTVDQFNAIAKNYPILTHGLSLSIGSVDELDWEYLKTLKAFLREHNIPWFTDHLCFTSVDHQQLHDLLPLPFTEEAVAHVADRARIVQDFLEIPLGLENVSYYAAPAPAEMTETDFIKAVLAESGCGLLLDLNNIIVNHKNHGTDPIATLNALQSENILHIHIAGHAPEAEGITIDSHGATVCHQTWDLLQRLGNVIALPPVLIERDNNFPPLVELLHDVSRARDIVRASRQRQEKIAS